MHRFRRHARMRVKSSQTPMRHRAPYATTSTNQTKPGRSGYLRGVLCVLRQSAAPLGAHMAAAQSRCNLAISGGISRHPDCGEIAQLPCGPLEVQLTDGACVALPGDIRSGRACSDSLIWSQMALSGACYDQGAGAPATRCAVGRSGVPRECMASHARQWASHACSPSRGTTGCL